MKKTQLFIPIGILASVTGLSGAALINSGVHAAVTVPCVYTDGAGECRTDTDPSTYGLNVSVTVAASCNYGGEDGSKSSTKSITNGNYEEYTSVNTLHVTCNDPSGVRFEAIGNSANASGVNTEGVTVMRAGTGAGSLTFNTGSTNPTSGTASEWGFKIADGGGATTATIPATFQNYTAVPDEWTRVGYSAGATNMTSGMAITTSYRVYIGTTQPAGSYSGQVKYRFSQGAGS